MDFRVRLTTLVLFLYQIRCAVNMNGRSGLAVGFLDRSFIMLILNPLLLSDFVDRVDEQLRNLVELEKNLRNLAFSFDRSFQNEAARFESKSVVSQVKHIEPFESSKY